MKKGIIYLDFDGTLISPLKRLYRLHADLCKDFSAEAYPEEEYTALKRNGVSEERLIGHRVVSQDIQAYLRKRMELIEAPDYLKNDSLFPWTLPTLRELRAHSTLILVTRRKYPDRLLVQLKAFHLDEFFEQVLVSGTAGDGKKRLISQSSHSQETKACIVGDTEEEIEVGRALKIESIAVASGMRTKEFLSKYRPDFIVRDLSEIPALLTPV